MAERKTRATSRRASAKKATKKATKKSKSSSVPEVKTKKNSSSKVVKKATKKAVKKKVKGTIANKVVKKKPAAAKAKKLASNKFLSSNTKTEKPPDDTVSVDTKHRVGTDENRVTIFSRVKTGNSVLLVARVLGLVFVLSGALLSITGVGNSMDGGLVAKVSQRLSLHLLANLPGSITGVDSLNTTLDTDGSLDTTPNVRIDIPAGTLSGNVDLSFTVVLADKVHVSAMNQGSNISYALGQAKSSDGTLWKLRWDTTSFPSGDYKLAVHVTNRYGAYQQKGTKVLSVQNTLINQTTSEEGVDTVSDENTNSFDEGLTELKTQADALSDISAEIIPSLTLPSTPPTEPQALISVNESSPVSNRVTVQALTNGATFAEFYARQQDSLRDVFLGLGRQTSENIWQFQWDTTQTPNGTYKLISKHKNPYGFYWSEPVEVIIKNNKVTEPTEAEKVVIDTIKTTNAEVANPIVEFRATINDYVTDEGSSATTTVEVIKKVNLLSDYAAELRDYSQDIENAMQAYAKALRHDDIIEQRQALRAIDELKNTIAINAVGKESITNPDEFKAEIEGRFNHLTSDIVETQAVLKKRIGDAATKDSDNDGVTDYDEVTLYKTNPFSADSDNDGFTDEAEILGGFNPNDDSQESPIVFESPKETGVIREDIFVVENIVTDRTQVSEGENVHSAAILSGRALPNSFVTIYIFSTPIVITVKTNEDGSWNYRFDKELEDGEHQVFVGVTDNAGKIVAKSNPFTFVKEAEAFSPVSGETSAGIIISEPPQPSLLSQNGLLIAIGSVIMALGFVLLILTLYFGRRQRGETVNLAHAI